MLKKIFIFALILSAICLTGCGADKVVGSPDKAVLAYAEISMFGESDNMSAAGFTDADKKEIRFNMANTFIKAMENITPLSDDAAQQITDNYFDNMKGKVNFQVTLKQDDSERPIVTLTTTPIDQTASARVGGAKNDEIIALIGMVGQLKADGATDEQLKENSNVQNLAVTALTKYIDNIQFKPQETLEVPCKKMTGHDGNIHWAPANEDAFVNFLTGQN